MSLHYFLLGNQFHAFTLRLYGAVGWCMFYQRFGQCSWGMIAQGRMDFLWILPFLTMHRVMATGNFLLAVFSQVLLPTTVLEFFSPIPRPPLLLFLMLLSSTRTIPFCLISNWASVFFHCIPNHSELLTQTKTFSFVISETPSV